MQPYSNFSQETVHHQSSQYGNGNVKPSSSAYKNSASLFLDVIDDNARWQHQAPQPMEASASSNRYFGSYSLPIFGKNESEQVPQPMTISSMVARGNVLGLDRALPAYDVVVAGAEQKKEDGNGFLGLKGSYIGYILQTTRLRDGTVALTTKRYSAIRSFFEDLLARGAIPKYAAPSFPPKETVGHSSDVQGSFIARRRIELQSYLQRLFSAVPSLWELPSIRDFFALNTLKYGARYVPPPGTEIVAVPPSEGGWKPMVLASQAAAAIGEKLGIGESKEPVVVEADPNMVRQICEMGFPERQVRVALETTKNDPVLATELIVNGTMVPPAGGWDIPANIPDPYLPYSEPPQQRSSRTHDWLSMPPPPVQSEPPMQPQSNSWLSRPQSAFSSLYNSGASSTAPVQSTSNTNSQFYLRRGSTERGNFGSAGPGTVDV